jgi:hypothetical protein
VRYDKKIRELNGERGKQNRINGEQFEFRILRYYKGRSDVLFAIRSAGSHSIVDIVVQFKRGIQYLISCRNNSIWLTKERRELEELQSKVPSNVKVKLAYYITPKKYVIRDV